MCTICNQSPCASRCPNAAHTTTGIFCNGYREFMLPDTPYIVIEGAAYSLYYLNKYMDAEELLELLKIPVLQTNE